MIAKIWTASYLALGTMRCMHNQNEVELEHGTCEGRNPESFAFCTGI